MKYSISDEWVAGFFEGEGCVTLNKVPTTPPGPQVNIAQKNPTILHMIQEKYGGKLSLDSNGVWALKWFNKDVLMILVPLLPHLLIKKPRAEVAIEMAHNVSAGRGHHLTEEQRNARWLLAERMKQI